jgi:hypothetical protein
MGAWGSAAGGFTSKEEVREFVRSFCETEEAEVKDVDFKDKCYATIEEAKQSANDDKWGNAVAVSYYDLPEKINRPAVEVLVGPPGFPPKRAGDLIPDRGKEGRPHYRSRHPSRADSFY